MTKQIMACFITLLCVNSMQAQHADLQFSYEDDMIVFREDGFEGFGDGVRVYQGTFPTGGFSIRFTENPGFLAEMANGDRVDFGDEIEIEILQSPAFGTYLTYFDEALGALTPTDSNIRIDDNMGTNTADLFIANSELTGENPQFIQTADQFDEVHAHIDFQLSDNADPILDTGAYGILFRLLTNNPTVQDSEPVWLVFNYGMSPTEFEELALPTFIGSDILLGDVNLDGQVNLLDVAPFVTLVSNGGFQAEADINSDGVVNLLDVDPFVNILSN